jgi:hypothetical protein
MSDQFAKEHLHEELHWARDGLLCKLDCLPTRAASTQPRLG